MTLSRSHSRAPRTVLGEWAPCEPGPLSEWPVHVPRKRLQAETRAVLGPRRPDTGRNGVGGYCTHAVLRFSPKERKQTTAHARISIKGSGGGRDHFAILNNYIRVPLGAQNYKNPTGISVTRSPVAEQEPPAGGFASESARTSRRRPGDPPGHLRTLGALPHGVQAFVRRRLRFFRSRYIWPAVPHRARQASRQALSHDHGVFPASRPRGKQALPDGRADRNGPCVGHLFHVLTQCVLQGRGLAADLAGVQCGDRLHGRVPAARDTVLGVAECRHPTTRYVQRNCQIGRAHV